MKDVAGRTNVGVGLRERIDCGLYDPARMGPALVRLRTVMAQEWSARQHRPDCAYLKV